MSADLFATVDRLLTEAKAAAFLGLQPQTLATWRCVGRYGLKFVRVGRSVRYRTSDLEEFLLSRTSTSTGMADANDTATVAPAGRKRGAAK